MKFSQIDSLKVKRCTIKDECWERVRAVFSHLITSEYFPVSDDDDPAGDVDAQLPL